MTADNVEALLSELPEVPNAPAKTASGERQAKPAGWADGILTGPTPSERNTTMWQLINHYRGRHFSDVEIEALARTLAERWDYDAEEYRKLDAQLRRAGEWEPTLSTAPTVPAERPKRFGIVDDDDTVSFGDMLAGFLAYLDEPERPDLLIPTGIAPLDDKLGGGIFPGEQVYVGAATSVGKTALGGQAALNVAKTGAAVLYVSAEMSKYELICRQLALETHLPLQAFLDAAYGRQYLDEMRRKGAHAALARLDSTPLRVSRTIRSADALRRRLDAEPDIRLVVVDYLQKLVQASGQDSSRGPVEALSSALADIAKTYGVAVVTLSQMSRPSGSNDTGDKPADDPIPGLWYPRLTSFRESGMLEADCDTAILLARHREGDQQHRLACRVAKRRNGAASGWFELGYVGKLTKVVSSPRDAKAMGA